MIALAADAPPGESSNAREHKPANAREFWL